jgi:glycosyltransferase involved in cell wall biosynthesis
LEQVGSFDLSVYVVDDCSQDDTRAVCAQIAESDSRVRVIPMEQNRGAPYCRNVGIEAAEQTSDFIAFQDSDDVWLPGKLDRQIRELTATGGQATACRVARVGKRGVEVSPSAPGDDGLIGQSDLLRRNYVSTQALLVRAQKASELKFDVRLPRFQDWEYAIRLTSGSPMAVMPFIGVVAPVSDNSITKDATSGFVARVRILEKHHRLYQQVPATRLRLQFTAVLLSTLTELAGEERDELIRAAGIPSWMGSVAGGSWMRQPLERFGKGSRQ